MGNGDRLRVLIAGGGIAALEAALALRALGEEKVDVELLAPENEFAYRPMAVAEPFGVGEMVRLPLAPLVEAAGARLRSGRLAAVEPDTRLVRTEAGDELVYDVLLLALGAVARRAVPGALTFHGPQDAAALAELLMDARQGNVRRLVFAVPEGFAWPLPLYELALLTEAHLADAGVSEASVTLVTPEREPLEIFGARASEAIRELLEVRGIGLCTGARPVEFANGRLRLEPDGSVEAQAVIALPLLEGPAVAGLPQDEDGFVPTDELGRVDGLDDVYAAGDIVSFPIKQGGLAAQQADAAASAIAARAGAASTPTPFTPVLRGLLLTGGTPRYLRGESRDLGSLVDTEALWWPPAKVVGRYLAPFLADRAGIREPDPSAWTPPSGAIPVELELDRRSAGPHPIG